MHIEPGVVDGAKIVLSYATAAGTGAYALNAAWKHIKERGAGSLMLGSAATTALVLVFFQVFPHYPVGVSEVHLILGSTLFLLFGAAPAPSDSRWVSSSRAWPSPPSTCRSTA